MRSDVLSHCYSLTMFPSFEENVKFITNVNQILQVKKVNKAICFIGTFENLR